MSVGSNHRPLRDIVCDAIREQIIGGQHRPGTRLVEDHLAQELGVSRSPVREALRVLEVEGYVDMIPRKGVVVATLSMDEAAEIFEVRIALESLAARLAARKATDATALRLDAILTDAERAHIRRDVGTLARRNTEFHGLVLDLAGNGYLRDVMIPLRGRMQWIFSQTAEGDRGSHSLSEHRELARAIADHDEERAALSAASHVRAAQVTFEAFRDGAAVTWTAALSGSNQ
jgi:DNA-binding GntR family transcriptional regulator